MQPGKSFGSDYSWLDEYYLVTKIVDIDLIICHDDKAKGNQVSLSPHELTIPPHCGTSKTMRMGQDIRRGVVKYSRIFIFCIKLSRNHRQASQQIIKRIPNSGLNYLKKG